MNTEVAAATPETRAPLSEALPASARLHEFEVRGVIGVGGFGIVYRAWDHTLEREVALKEYLPLSLAGRGDSSTVALRAPSHGEAFAMGLRSFVDEARLLARFDHPALVKVHRFWEGGGTAYMVMQLYRGRTLRDCRKSMTSPPDAAKCMQIIEPLLSGLEQLHRDGVYHRDIAPDNILVGDDGVPVLLDFGAARRVISSAQALTAILKPSFAPLEQYGDAPAMRQGPWTDLYALGATLHYFLTGQAPPSAASRVLYDEYVPLAQRGSPGCPTAFLEAIDWTLALHPRDRPQDVAAWRGALRGRNPVPAAVSAPASAPSAVQHAATAAIEPTVRLASTVRFEPSRAEVAKPARDLSRQPRAVTVAAAQSPREWVWTAKVCGVAFLTLLTSTSLSTMDLFAGTFLVHDSLSAAHLMRMLGAVGALSIMCWLSERAYRQFAVKSRKTTYMARLWRRTAALFALPCGYAAVLPLLESFRESTPYAVFNWAFILASIAAAGWVTLSIFQPAAAPAPRESTLAHVD